MALVGHTASVGRVAGLPRRSRECHRRCSRVCLQATGDDEIERSRDELERLVSEENAETLSGSELRNLIVSQFGKPFDTRLRQQRDAFNDLNMYLQVMWKHLGQKSFPLTEEQYNDQLQAVAELLTEWGCVRQAVDGIKRCRKGPGVSTQGARAVMIKLDLAIEGNRSAEFL